MAVKRKSDLKTPKKLPRDNPELKQMRERYLLVNDAEADQDQREREDIQFEDGDQWPADLRLARQGQQPVNGLPAVPARPTLVIDTIKEPVRQILNQERASDLGIQITPADDFGDLGLTPDDTEIQLREGLVRRIQRESHAADARSWAYKRSVIAGRGYYIVRTRYLPGATWDQEIYVDRIFNQSGVKLDPAHEKPDGSDAEWEFMGTWMPWDKFKREYPYDADGKENPFTRYSDDEFMGLTEDYPTWYKSEGDGQHAIRITDYWRTELTPRTLGLTADGHAFWVGDPPDDATPEEAAKYAPKDTPFEDTRPVTERVIKFLKVAGGCMELERTDGAGPDMPIIKVVGEEVLPYDEQRRYKGVVRPARDAQMGLNYMISKQVEVLGLAPIPLLQLDPEAIEGYESWYDVINTRTLPYAPYRSFNDQGRELRPPTRLAVDPNIYPISQSVQMFKDAIRTTTNVPDSSLGNVDPALKSGRAIREVVQNAQLSTSNFLDNLVRSIRYEGQIVNNLLYPIYGTKPGRLVRILTGEGDSQTMRVGAGPSQPTQPGAVAPGGQPGQPGAPQAPPSAGQQASKVAKLTKDANFNIIVKVAKSTESRRQQFMDMFGQLLSAEPAQMQVAGDLFYKNMDIPEARELAKRQRVMLALPVQQLIAKEEQGQTYDPAAQAQIAQLTQQLQQLQQVNQQQGQALQTNQLDNQAKMQVEQLKTQSDQQIKQAEFARDLKLEEMKNATQIAVAQIAASTKTAMMQTEAQNEAQATGHAQAHEVGMTAMDQAHEQQMAQQQQAQASQLAAQQAGHQQDAQAQQAALQPPPQETPA